MSALNRIESKDGKRIVEVLRDEDGTFVLRKRVRKYDRDEDRWYEIRERPDPSGRFADREAAVAEANALLRLNVE